MLKMLYGFPVEHGVLYHKGKVLWEPVDIKMESGDPTT
jgi:hypothetical protein